MNEGKKAFLKARFSLLDTMIMRTDSNAKESIGVLFVIIAI